MELALELSDISSQDGASSDSSSEFGHTWTGIGQLDGKLDSIYSAFEQILLNSESEPRPVVNARLDAMLLQTRLWANDIGQLQGTLQRVEERSPNIAKSTTYVMAEIERMLAELHQDFLHGVHDGYDESLESLEGTISNLTSQIAPFCLIPSMITSVKSSLVQDSSGHEVVAETSSDSKIHPQKTAIDNNSESSVLANALISSEHELSQPPSDEIPNIHKDIVSREALTRPTVDSQLRADDIETRIGITDFLHVTTSRPSPGTRAADPPSFPNTCEACEKIDIQIFFCTYCDAYFCDACWGKEGPHRLGKVAFDGLPHEKVDIRVFNRLNQTFKPPSDPNMERKLHMDKDTAWFGIERDLNNLLVFQDYGRFTTLMANSAGNEYGTKYPQLVSFIGNTGAGKSTIIKLLIEQQSSKSEDPFVPLFPSPIVYGTRNNNRPTSGEVHLYADPSTYTGVFPLLYADCEGLEVKKKKPKFDGKRRDIEWASSPETSMRQYAAKELYPRLLYVFSDVIVFVFQNIKTFKSSLLSMLLDLAHVSMEKALNQPTLPHAIIILNATDAAVNPEEWDVDWASQALFNSVAGALAREPKWGEYANYFISRGKVIRTVYDLLLCYYSSVRVVRIPKRGRYMLIDEQVAKLHKEITSNCRSSYYAKRQAHMFYNSKELNMYLQCAFDHFAQNLQTPFNFIEVAWKNQPIREDFGRSILKLATTIQAYGSPLYKGPLLFRELSNMVASCMMLDCARRDLRGPADILLNKYYIHDCDYAIEDFYTLFWQCTYRNGEHRCVNAQIGHSKGHQNERGKIIGIGPYESDFSYNTLKGEWSQLLQQAIQQLQANLHQSFLLRGGQVTEQSCANEIHKREMQKFYPRLGGATKFRSHAVCFCCLKNSPEHPLPCGHVLCTPCIQAYGNPGPGASFEIESCPLHANDGGFSRPWTVKFKPALAGVRILALDGGGIRSIVELEVLRAIEREIGVQIPIHQFFDLIVGTNTGGIISLGLGVQHWSISDCTQKILKLVDKAFTPRLPSLGSGSKYKTKAMVDALQDAFPQRNLFGGEYDGATGYHTKVVLTAANETGEQPVILTNYNRQLEDQPVYNFIRPDAPEHELVLWEAARATSASPTFFKPFVNKHTNEGYLDGALFHNNPVRVAYRESKLIWPDVADLHPDILLSIGTGHNGQDMSRPAETANPQRSRSFKDSSLGQIYTVLVNRLDKVLNSEQIWQEFYENRDFEVGSADASQRYQRLNPYLGFPPPKLDDKAKFHQVQAAAQKVLKSSQDYKLKVTRIAYRLIASSFYFENRKDAEQIESGWHELCGTIRCRFPDGSSELRELGKFLQEQYSYNFHPFFRIHETRRDAFAVKIFITLDKVKNMISHAQFQMGLIRFRVSENLGVTIIGLGLFNRTTRNEEVIPISGFPSTILMKLLSGVDTTIPQGPRRANFPRNRNRMPEHYDAYMPPGTIHPDVSSSEEARLSTTSVTKHPSSQSTYASTISTHPSSRSSYASTINTDHSTVNTYASSINTYDPSIRVKSSADSTYSLAHDELNNRGSRRAQTASSLRAAPQDLRTPSGRSRRPRDLFRLPIGHEYGAYDDDEEEEEILMMRAIELSLRDDENKQGEGSKSYDKAGPSS